jgi:hypothetical protein
MATTFVQINTTNRLGNQLRAAIDQLRTGKDQLARLKAIMDTQIDGSNYSLLESQFGLQTAEGATCYNLVAGAVGDLALSNTTQLLTRCG